jgi:hypothetical protein
LFCFLLYVGYLRKCNMCSVHRVHGLHSLYEDYAHLPLWNCSMVFSEICNVNFQ